MNNLENDTSYKAIHEKFVSGWSGTSLFEVSVLISIPAASLLLRDLTCLVFDHLKNPWIFILNFSLIVMPLLLGCTVLSFTNVTLLVSLYTVAVGIFTFILTKQKEDMKTLYDKMSISPMGMRRPFVTYSRAQALLGTAVAILGVDFTIFPRRFAKAETYGTGVMDTGVGLFVVMNAIVSSEARGKQSKKGVVQSLVHAVKSSAPLVVLGGARLLAVKNIDYQEHVTEYGVHWNFFLTLAAVKILSTVILTVFPPTYSGALSVTIAVLYQCCLTLLGLASYIIHGRDGKGGREGLLDANREGVFSTLGYLSIYLAGVEIGRFIFKQRNTVKEWIMAMLTLFLVSTILWICLGLSTLVEPISRRLANAPFVLWMVAVNSYLLAIYLAGDILVTYARQLMKGKKESEEFDVQLSSTCLLSAMNYNGLLYFLVANVLTGLVNMSIQTVYTPPSIALCILIIYMLALSLLVTVLYAKKISTKFW